MRDGAVAGHAETFGKVVAAIESGDNSAAASLLTESDGDDLGLSPELQERVNDIAGARQPNRPVRSILTLQREVRFELAAFIFRKPSVSVTDRVRGCRQTADGGARHLKSV